jgi:hypothetical protein
VGIIEPSNVHYYQPLWTLVGGGQKTMAQSMRDMGSLIPTGADWIRDAAASFKPESNTVVTQKGQEVRGCALPLYLNSFRAKSDIIGIVKLIESNGPFVSPAHIRLPRGCRGHAAADGQDQGPEGGAQD